MTTTKVLVPRIQRDSSVSSSGSSSELVIRSTPGRKRKLDHLTHEEKVQRKKLKNRVAAQTSRDRKKKQMEEMLVTIEKQTKEISQWEHRYNQLKTKYDKLEREVTKLKQANKSTSSNSKHAPQHHSIPEEHKYTRLSQDQKNDKDSFVGSAFIKSEGPAASAKPLPKVLTMKSETTEKSPVNSQKKNDVRALLKVVMLCLLYKNSSLESTSNTTLKSLQRALSPISTQTWKSILQQAVAQMPKMKAANANCLDQWWISQCLGPENREWNPPKIALKAHWGLNASHRGCARSFNTML